MALYSKPAFRLEGHFLKYYGSNFNFYTDVLTTVNDTVSVSNNIMFKPVLC